VIKTEERAEKNDVLREFDKAKTEGKKPISLCCENET
jgi:hypothetical protein